MPVRIYALFHYLAEERPRVQRMFLDAGLLDLVVDDDRLTGFQRVRVPDEDTAARLLVAARLHDLAEPMLHRVLEPTRRELASVGSMTRAIHSSPPTRSAC